MQITVYGASDDLIEVEGPLTEEFTYRDDEAGDVLGFSDGTLLRVRYDENGTWRITPIRKGPAFQGIDQAVEGDDDNYTDRAILTSNVEWVLQGNNYARAAAR